MDGEKAFEAIPEALPPPAETEPSLPPMQAGWLRRAYRCWCIVTLAAALLTLGLLAARGVRLVQGGGDGYLGRLILQRLVGAGEEDGALLELVLGRTLYSRYTAPAVEVVKPVIDPPAPPVAETEQTVPVREPLNLYDYDPSSVPEGEKPILPLDLSLTELGTLYISNETAYTPDLAALLVREHVLPAYDYASAAVYPPGDPLVLILHTHATEAYSPDGATSYPIDAADYARSQDTAENVVAVGARMAEVLRASGVPTLHCTVLHDETSYQDSYIRAAETIRTYLAKYPSIQYVFDVHRDALVRGDGELVRPVVEVDGEAVAQVLILAGSDYKGAFFPDWEDNLAFALQLRGALNNDYPAIARPVYLRGAAFNEHYATRSLLLEVGASGNSLAEAMRAGELLAGKLADMITAAR